MTIDLSVPSNGKAQFNVFSIPVLKTRDLPGPLWELCDDFGFYSAIVKEWIVVPKGFRTDGCSVPSFALSLVGYVADEPGYVHDWLYTTQRYPRATCDMILREMLLVRGYDHIKAEEFYLAVRAGGGSHWELPNAPQEPRIQAVLAASV